MLRLGSHVSDDVTEIVAQLSALLGPRGGEIEPILGALTRLAFKVRLGGSDYVVHLPGGEAGLLGIDPRSEQEAGARAAELGVAPPVVARLERPACFVTELVPGRPLDAEDLRRPAALAELAAALRTFHDCGLELPRRFDPYRWVEEQVKAASSRGVEPPEGYAVALAQANEIERTVGRHRDHRITPCHANLRPPNLWHDGERILIDGWRYAAMCDRFYDLGDLAASIELDDEGERLLLAAYFDEEPGSRRLAAIKLTRFLSDLVEAAWGLVESGLAKHDVDYSGHASEHFRRLGETGTNPQFKVWINQASKRK